MRRRLTAFLTTLVLLSALLLRAAEAPPHRTLAGEIEGARWTALVPDNWDGRLLIEAPDCRHAPEPLVATIDPADSATDKLLTAGWAVATTSYRRHGPLVADGIDDLRALRDHLVEELGLPRLTLVEGTGMGGLIATFIAERHADEFHGCIAHDPQLDLRDPRALRLRCDHQPRAPLLILATRGAAELGQNYIARARTAANAESVVPVFWFVPADTSAADQLALRLDAQATMEEWVRTRQPPDERPVPPPPPEPEAEAAAPADSHEVPGAEAPGEVPVPARTPVVPTPNVPPASTSPTPTVAP